MKILFALDKYSLATGGAPRTAQQVVLALDGMGHEVEILEHDGRQTYHVEATAHIPKHRRKLSKIGDNTIKTFVHNRQWPKHLEEFCRCYKPNLILTQGHLAISTVSFAKQAGIKSMVFMHGLETLSPNFFYNQDPFAEGFNFWTADIRQKFKYPLMKKVLNKYQNMYQTADCVVANSRFMQDLLKQKLSINSHLLYPPIAKLTETYTAPQLTSESFILFVKPQVVKGVALFHKLAKKLPNHKFVAVGKAPSPHRQRLSSLANVTTLAQVADLKEIYKQSSLILGPSLIPEPFGRVFVEAGFYGVPSVAFETGGITEAVGEGGLLLPRTSTVDDWAAAIDKALDPQNYSSLSAAAFANAQEIVASSTKDRLATIIDAAMDTKP